MKLIKIFKGKGIKAKAIFLTTLALLSLLFSSCTQDKKEQLSKELSSSKTPIEKCLDNLEEGNKTDLGYDNKTASIKVNEDYIFDDIFNESKVSTRAFTIIENLKKAGISHELTQEDVEWMLKIFNAGKVDKIDENEVRYAYRLLSDLMYKNIVDPANEFAKGKWTGDYVAFDFSSFLIDGSDGQELAALEYESFNKIYTGKKSSVETNSNYLMKHVVETEDLRGFLGGPSIGKLRLKLHTAFNITYNRIALTFLGTKSSKTTYTYPKDLPKEICKGGKISASELLKILNSIDLSEYDSSIIAGVRELQVANKECMRFGRKG